MTRVQRLRDYLEEYYKEYGQNLLFHGWHHIIFVTDKAVILAKELDADIALVEAAALTHDLNYLIDTYSRMTEGEKLREKVLLDNGYNGDEIVQITKIVNQADLQGRKEGNTELSLEAQILSDADTLFKSLPITIPVFSGRYLEQTGISLRQLSSSIVNTQLPLMEKGIYFYTEPYRQRYSSWAKHNLQLWQFVLQNLDDADTQKMLETIGIKA